MLGVRCPLLCLQAKKPHPYNHLRRVHYQVLFRCDLNLQRQIFHKYTYELINNDTQNSDKFTSSFQRRKGLWFQNIHWSSPRNGNGFFPLTASCQSAVKSSWCISSHAVTNLCFFGGWLFGFPNLAIDLYFECLGIISSASFALLTPSFWDIV